MKEKGPANALMLRGLLVPAPPTPFVQYGTALDPLALPVEPP